MKLPRQLQVEQKQNKQQQKKVWRKKKYDLYPEKVYQYFYIMCPRTVMSDS